MRAAPIEAQVGVRDLGVDAGQRRGQPRPGVEPPVKIAGQERAQRDRFGHLAFGVAARARRVGRRGGPLRGLALRRVLEHSGGGLQLVEPSAAGALVGAALGLEHGQLRLAAPRSFGQRDLERAHVLEAHRVALQALAPVLVGDPDEGVFSERTAFSRQRVQPVFEDAVVGAIDAPKQPLAAALGRLLYLVHLAVLLWWLFDKSSRQRATSALVSLTAQLLPSATLALRVPPVRRFVIAVDELIRQALFGGPVSV